MNMTKDQRKLAAALEQAWNAIGFDAQDALGDRPSSLDCGWMALEYIDTYGGLTREEADRLVPLATKKFLKELALGY